MIDSDQIYGAKASVYLKSEKSFEGVVKSLNDTLLLNSQFEVQYDESPPHKLVAYMELLGFEGCLSTSNDIESFLYKFEMSTEHISPAEISNGQTHDLSLWLARYCYDICGFDSYCEDVHGNGFIFSANTVCKRTLPHLSNGTD